MATGRRPFQGDTPLSTLTAILRDTPKPLTVVNPAVPHHFGRIVRRCLEKDPARRYQTAVDLRNDLDDLKREIDAGGPIDDATVRGAPRLRSRRAAIAGTSIALVLGVVAGILIGRRSQDVSTPRAEIALRPLTANPAELPVYGAAISPDGKYVAYTDANGLFLRIIDTGETQRVPVPENWRFWDVSWFPDGTKLLVTGPSASGETMSLYSVPTFGGTPRKLQDDAWRAAVSPDGTAIAFIRARYPVREVWLMGAGGEQPRRVVEGKADETFWQVGWSPDSGRIVYGRMSKSGNSFDQDTVFAIEARVRDGQQSTVLVSGRGLFQNWRGILPFCWLSDGRLVFAFREPPPNADSSNLCETRIDPRTAMQTSAPRRLTQLGNYNIRDIRSTLDGTRLTFLRERNQADVYVAPLESAPARLGPPRRVTLDDRSDEPMQWTPDARTIVFESSRSGGWGVFKQRVDEGTADLLASGTNDPYPRVTPDGGWVLFARDRQLMRVPIAGGPSEPVLEGRGSIGADCANAPATRCVMSELLGNALTFSEVDPLRGRGRELRRFETTAPDFTYWRLSPDGERIALVDFSDRVRVFDLSGGSSRDLSVPSWTAFEFVAWAANGQSLFVTGFLSAGHA